MALKLKNKAVSRLAAGIAAGDLSLSVVPGEGALFPTLGAGDYFPATLIRASDLAVEVIKVTARATDALTIERAQESTTALAFLAGDRVELRMTAQTFLDLAVESVTHAATSKATPVDADELPLVDSAASNVLKKLTWANVKATLFSSWGALTTAGTSKATPVDADSLAICDSAASDATKKLTWANVKATLKTYFDTLYAAKSEIQAQTYTAYTTGGSSTAYTLTPAPAVAALAENQEFDVEFHTSAGATPTLAVSGLTAKSLKYRDSAGAKQAVTSTQIPSGWRSKVVYDGTDYIVREIPPEVNAAPIFTVSYDSGDQTITAGGSLPLEHSLGAAPKIMQCLLKCNDAGGDLGYSNGDYVFINTTGADGGSTAISTGVSVVPDATHLNVRFGSDAAVFLINRKDTGALNSITASKWKFIARAYA